MQVNNGKTLWVDLKVYRTFSREERELLQINIYDFKDEKIKKIITQSETFL